MANTIFVCESCGVESHRWQGRCFECQAYGSFVERVVERAPKSRSRSKAVTVEAEQLSRIKLRAATSQRIGLPLGEVNRALGGGLIPGMVVLLGGEPGIGKSTLLLQVCQGKASPSSKPSKEGVPQAVLYVSGEESAQQIKLRAERLGVTNEQLFILTENDVDNLLAAISQQSLGLAFVIVDSIQTVYTGDLSSPAGSISQVQECSRRLINLAKSNHLPFILVGHVTKAGHLAGPKTLEHLVDTVLYLEGERFSNFRILRCVKNRFGAVNELGIFSMTDYGLEEVLDPNKALLAEREKHTDAAGSVLTVSMEGQRPLVIEMQTLVTPTSFGLPRRVANGVDANRLLMLLAVLQRHAGLNFGNFDVYVNVSGGLRLKEPGADLAVGLALYSSLKNKILPSDLVAIGEIGLLGEIKPVMRQAERLKEAKKLGYKRVLSAADFTSIREVIKSLV